MAREEPFPGFWRAVEDIVPGMAAVVLCPTGGESVGALLFARASTIALGRSEEEAIVALHKARFALDQETPYTRWRGDLAKACARDHRAWRASMVAPTPERTRAFVDWLRGRGEDVLIAQRDGSIAPQPPRLLDLGPGALAPPSAIPEDLHELTLANLVRALDDRWSSPAGLFRTSTSTLLVEWWTSA